MSSVTRLVVVLASSLITLVTYAAGGHLVAPVAIAIGLLTAACVLHPDTHLGLLLVVLLGAQWLHIVDDELSPWAVAAAAGLAVLHIALAAATVAPPSARWTRAMTGRWLRRGSLLCLPGFVSWLVAGAFERQRSPGSALWLTAALVLIAVGGVWAGVSRSRPGRS